jgi:hypothetical protein
MKKLLLYWKKIALGAIVGVVLGGGGGYIVFVQSTPMWEGNSVVLLGLDTPLLEQIHVILPLPSVVIETMRSREFIVDATSRAGRPDLARLLIDTRDGGEGLLQLKTVRNSPTIVISARAPSKDDARVAVAAVSSELIRTLRSLNQPVLDYAKQFLNESEALIEKDRRNFASIEDQLQKMRQSKVFDESKYLSLLSLQSQNAISRGQLLNRVVGVKVDYLTAFSKLPREISSTVVSAQAVSPNLELLVLTGMILGLLIGLAVSFAVIVARDIPNT